MMERKDNTRAKKTKRRIRVTIKERKERLKKIER